MKRVAILRWSLALALVGSAGFWYGRSRAQSAPPTTPVIYTGFLEDSGTPVNGTRDIGLNLWTSTDTSTTANRVCEQAAASTTVSAGWFTVQLGSACLDAVHRYPALFLEFIVDTTPFPLRPIGAVPYAVRSFEHENGSRLKKIYRTVSDGSKELIEGRWWDSQRNEECTLQEAGTPARTKLCLPESGITPAALPGACDAYADSNCSIPATGGAVSGDTPKYVPASGASSGLALPGQPVKIYCMTYGTAPCYATNADFYFASTLLPASDFASWQEQHD